MGMTSENNFTSYLFYRSTKKINKKGVVPIYCRITFMGKRSEFCTGILVEPHFFSDGKIIVKNSTLNNYQKQLDVILSDLIEIETNIKIKKQPLSAERIKHIYVNGFVESYGIFSYVADEWLDKQRQLVDIDFRTEGYLRRKRTIEKFNGFLKTCHKTQIYICELKENIINDFCLYCYTTLNLSKAYVKREVTIIKTIVDYAVINDYTAKNYIAHYRVKLSRYKQEIKSLSIEQVKILKETRFNSIALQYVRDCFLFQCYTGLAHTDVSEFSMQHVSTDNMGKLWLIIHRQKTSTKSTVPLIPEALEIINKYSDLNHRVDSNIKNSGLLPVYCNQVYNRLLKEIGLICNLDTSLMCSHTARKTFAMVVLNSGNVSIETVSKMLGHTKIGMTQQYYAYVDTKKIANEMRNFSFTNSINN